VQDTVTLHVTYSVIQIKVLGTMLPVEDQLLPTGMIASVTTPEYFLTECRMKNMEMDLISNSHASQKEGEGTD
jgi:hypothetical protein